MLTAKYFSLNQNISINSKLGYLAIMYLDALTIITVLQLVSIVCITILQFESFVCITVLQLESIVKSGHLNRINPVRTHLVPPKPMAARGASFLWWMSPKCVKALATSLTNGTNTCQ